tara:strand:- start:24 stop:233 length:210 start_codon:yes stop_codon:yes gene_type:complete
MKNKKTEIDSTRIIPHSEVVAMMRHLNMKLSPTAPENKAQYLESITNRFHEMYSKLKSTESASGSHEID